MKSLLFKLVVSLCLLDTISPEEVTKTGKCKWTSDTTGITLDLSGLNSFYEIYDQPTFYTYRYYPCGIEADWDATYCTASADTALCQTNFFDYVLVGTGGSVDAKVVTSSSNAATFELTYGNGASGRTGTMTITCDQTSDEFSFDTEVYPAYFFSFSAKSACRQGGPEGQGGNAPAFFLTLLIVSLIAATTYIVAGVLIMYFHKKARGVALIPNLEFWTDFPFLLKDGFLFTFSCYAPFREWIGGRTWGGGGGGSGKGGTYETVK